MDKFLDFWRLLAPEEKQAMADRLETSKVYLSQIAHKHRNPGTHFKRALEQYMRENERAA